MQKLSDALCLNPQHIIDVVQLEPHQLARSYDRRSIEERAGILLTSLSKQDLNLSLV